MPLPAQPCPQLSPTACLPSGGTRLSDSLAAPMVTQPAAPSPPHPDWQAAFELRPEVTYLNHGSFGPPARVTSAARESWSRRLASDPMDFYLREMENRLDEAREVLGRFVGTAGRNLAFVDNATFAMNGIAQGFPLKTGDVVLANDHEYGAVLRIWRERCRQTGAELQVASLPPRFTDPAEVVDTLLAAVTDRTRLVVVSHITSPTAVVLPVAPLCRRLRERGVAVCIDGPHAPAAVPVALDKLGCDFYCASLHKWLAAPLGSGFLYAHPRWQSQLQPPVVSWGNSLSGRSSSWLDPFNWLGTRDPAAFLAVPTAIAFLQGLTAPPDPAWSGPAAGLPVFQHYSHGLIRHARSRLVALTGCEPLVDDSPTWSATMLACPLPAAVPEPESPHAHQWQHELWRRHRIEVPIVNWHGRRSVRVSAHLYNTTAQIDHLVDALAELLGELPSAGG